LGDIAYPALPQQCAHEQPLVDRPAVFTTVPPFLQWILKLKASRLIDERAGMKRGLPIATMGRLY